MALLREKPFEEFWKKETITQAASKVWWFLDGETFLKKSWDVWIQV